MGSLINILTFLFIEYLSSIIILLVQIYIMFYININLLSRCTWNVTVTVRANIIGDSSSNT